MTLYTGVVSLVPVRSVGYGLLLLMRGEIPKDVLGAGCWALI